jgi:hypothetical protein
MADLDITSSSTNTVDVVGLNDIKADLKLELPQPLKTESSYDYDIKAEVGTKSDLAIEPLKADLGTTSRLAIDPLKTDSSVTLDLKPAVVDLCLTLNIGKVASVCIRQPYHHHFGFTLFGTEVWGFTVSGEQETVVQELDRHPHVAVGSPAPHWPSPHASSPSGQPPTRHAGGLRVRIGP